MTIRSSLDKAKRRLLCVAYAGGLLFIVSLPFVHFPGVWSVTLAGFAVGFCTQMYGHYFGFRWPSCSSPWRALAMECGKSLLSIDARIRFCPYCGEDIDVEIAGGETAAQEVHV